MLITIPFTAILLNNSVSLLCLRGLNKDLVGKPGRGIRQHTNRSTTGNRELSPSWRCYGHCAAGELGEMHDTQPQGTLTSPLFHFPASISFLNITFCTIFRDMSAHNVSDSSRTFSKHSYWPRHTLTYADAHSHPANVCGSVSLRLITVCSPPQMPAQDQETTV